jgi:hypothetical protein
MRLDPLYRLTFRYPEAWDAQGERLLIAEGRCEGRISGRFRGANRARRRSDGIWLPLLHGAIATDDGETILITLTGYGDPRAEPNGEVVASIVHAAEHDYAWLSRTLGVAAGEVRDGREIVLDVAALVWEPLDD